MLSGSFFSIVYICGMTEDENKFLAWWEINRDKQKKLVRQWFVGLPIGLIFVIPIIINLSSGWYKRAEMEANSQQTSPIVLLVAMIVIISFLAVFYKRHQWDMDDQRYKELKAKEKQEQVEADKIIRENIQ